MAGFGTCDICSREMAPGGGCSATHVGTSEKGPWVKRVAYGEEPEDWGAAEGRDCHDCNAGPGQLHHDGCDVERCPGCGRQMLQCGGEPDPEYEALTGLKPCPWTHLSTLPPASVDPDPVVKVVWKDEGDFGFINLVRRSDMDGHDPATTSWLEVLAERATRAKARGQTLGVPYDPNRQRPAGTRAQAKALAREHDAVLEEV
jgi:hypothetical protein